MPRSMAGRIAALTMIALGGCASSAGQSETTGATVGGDTGTASAGTTTTGGGCDLTDVARSLAADAAVNCGSGLSIPYLDPWDAGPFEQGVACAFASQDAGQPFWLQLESSGIDTGEAIAFVESPDGRSYILTQNWRVPGGESDVCEVACPGFVAAVFPYSVLPEDGGHPPGLGCLAPTPATVLCVGAWNSCAP